MKRAIFGGLAFILIFTFLFGGLALIPESIIPDKEYICTAIIEKVRCTGEWCYYNIELTLSNGRVLLVDKGALEQIKIGKTYAIYRRGERSSYVIWYSFEEK